MVSDRASRAVMFCTCGTGPLARSQERTRYSVRAGTEAAGPAKDHELMRPDSTSYKLAAQREQHA